MFAPAFSPNSLVRAGRLGLGVLNFSLSSAKEMKEKVRCYKELVAAAAPTDWQKNDRFCVTVNTCVLEDDDEACRYGFRGARYFRDSFDVYYSRPDRPPPGPLCVDGSELDRATYKMTKSLRTNENTQLLSVIGDPVLAREKVAMFEEAGVDELLLIMQLGTIPHEIVQRSLVCFAEKVMPYFQRRPVTINGAPPEATCVR
jgi:alkanesulfonate monooxygenase SsuD/methylene tetrahydromethanopterin reductase-like flavin-dependent oxidoreductase (luciferase family)